MSANLRSVSLAARQKGDPHSLPQRHNGDFSCNNSFLHSHFFFALENHNQGKGQVAKLASTREEKGGSEEERQGDWRLEIRTVLLPTGIDRDQTPTTIAHRMEAYDLR